VRTALGDDGTCILTHPKQGYRFGASVRVDSSTPSSAASADGEPSPVRSNGAFIAYQTIARSEAPAGGGEELDIVLVPGWVLPMSAYFELPPLRENVEALARLGRVILFDKRGTGLSDRSGFALSLQARVADLRAVLDAAGSRRAVLVGISEGGPQCLAAAATEPERTRGLVLLGSFARWSRAYDYPHGWPASAIARLRGYVEHTWGRGQTLSASLPSMKSNPALAAWAARAEQLGASPGAALALIDHNAELDVRALLPGVRAPSRVLHYLDDPVAAFANARYLAEHIPGARLVAVPGQDHLFVGEGFRHVLDAVLAVAQTPSEAPTRFLTTLLALSGDAALRWVDDSSSSAALSRHGGRRVGTAPCFSFDGPERALRCGDELSRALDVGAAVHIGQVSVERGALVGTCVDEVLALAAAARPRELLVSRGVHDLVLGSEHVLIAREALPLGGDKTLDAWVCGLPPAKSARQ